MSVFEMGISKRFLDSNYTIDTKKQKFILFDAESNLSRGISFIDMFIQLSRVCFLLVAAVFGLAFLILTAFSFLIFGFVLIASGLIFLMKVKYRDFFWIRGRVFLRQGIVELIFTLPCVVFSKLFFICFHLSLALGDCFGVFFPEIGRIFRSVNQAVVSVSMAFKGL